MSKFLIGSIVEPKYGSCWPLQASHGHPAIPANKKSRMITNLERNGSCAVIELEGLAGRFDACHFQQAEKGE